MNSIREDERVEAALTDLRGPEDLRGPTPRQLDDLAAGIRRFLVQKVSATGGHLGPNLGVVEMTIALHRVFRSPEDVILFDTGHQTYVHKILTGRAPGLTACDRRMGCPATPPSGVGTRRD